MIASPIETTAETLPSGSAAPAEQASSPHGEDAKVIVAPTLQSAPRREAEPNPFDEDVWRAEGGSDSQADAAGAYPIVGNPVRAAIVAFVRNKRNLAIAAGAAVVVIFGIVLASGGDDAERPPEPTASTEAMATANVEPAPEPPPPATEPTPEPAPDPAAETRAVPDEGAGSDAAAELTEAASEPAAKPSATTRRPATTKRKPRAPKKEPTIAGKQLVVESDRQALEDKPVAHAPKADQAAIARARRAYTAGNSRLFAGDADGAIRQYRQAIAHYSGYVAGYRGLGLAYAQKGDTANALKALRTYVRAVPGAKDASIIRRRIQALTAK